MRVLFYILMILGCTGLIVYYFAPETYSCVQPIRYSIGEYDERFGVSREDLLVALKKAEAVWEESAGKELFVYSDRGRFKINLIYDERQLRTDLAERSEGSLNEKQVKYQQADREYKNIMTDLEMAVADFNERTKKFNSERAKYSDKVRAWNRSARTDESKLEALRAEEKELRALEAELLRKESELSSKQASADKAMLTRNQLARDYNNEVAIYNQEFGTGESFDQGIYSRGQINVYQFSNVDDLALVLAHEFGHALGLGHVDDPKAVMYYLMEGQAKDPIKLTPADETALAVRCPF